MKIATSLAAAILAALPAFATAPPQRNMKGLPNVVAWMPTDTSKLMADLNRDDAKAAFGDAVLLGTDHNIAMLELSHKDVVIYNLKHPAQKQTDVLDLLTRQVPSASRSRPFTTGQRQDNKVNKAVFAALVALAVMPAVSQDEPGNTWWGSRRHRRCCQIRYIRRSHHTTLGSRPEREAYLGRSAQHDPMSDQATTT